MRRRKALLYIYIYIYIYIYTYIHAWIQECMCIDIVCRSVRMFSKHHLVSVLRGNHQYIKSVTVRNHLEKFTYHWVQKHRLWKGAQYIESLKGCSIFVIISSVIIIERDAVSSLVEGSQYLESLKRRSVFKPWKGRSIFYYYQWRIAVCFIMERAANMFHHFTRI
jgi:hypothetical protein